MNNNWPRWIYASASKHFKAAADVFGIHFYLEGTVPRDIAEHEDYVEFRADVTRVKEISKNYYQLDYEINILWSVLMGGSDFHKSLRISGMLTDAMSDLCIYKYGDSGDFLGTLVLEDTIVNNFGQVKNTGLVQGTVIGNYSIYLGE
jgi:hypothetical protein